MLKKKRKSFLKAINQTFSKAKMKKIHFQIQKYVRFTKAGEIEQTWAWRKREKCCGPWLKAADQLVSAKVHFLKVKRLSNRAKSYLFFTIMKEGAIGSAGWEDDFSSQLLFKQTREAGLQEELPRPLLLEATAPAGPQGAFHCVWLAAWALILANVTYMVVNFKTPSDTASKMYTERGKNFLKEQKNKQWMKIY